MANIIAAGAYSISTHSIAAPVAWVWTGIPICFEYRQTDNFDRITGYDARFPQQNQYVIYPLEPLENLIQN